MLRKMGFPVARASASASGPKGRQSIGSHAAARRYGLLSRRSRLGNRRVGSRPHASATSSAAAAGQRRKVTPRVCAKAPGMKKLGLLVLVAACGGGAPPAAPTAAGPSARFEEKMRPHAAAVVGAELELADGVA